MKATIITDKETIDLEGTPEELAKFLNARGQPLQLQPAPSVQTPPSCVHEFDSEDASLFLRYCKKCHTLVYTGMPNFQPDSWVIPQQPWGAPNIWPSYYPDWTAPIQPTWICSTTFSSNCGQTSDRQEPNDCKQ